MLTIRLTRKGKKNQPFFRLVVTEKKRSSKGGRAIEDLEFVNPLTKKNSINKERALHWIKNGAQPSDTVHNLLVTEKIIEGTKINVSKKKPVVASAETSVPVAAPAAATAAPEAPTAEPAKPAEEPKPDLPAQAGEKPAA